MAEGSRPDHFKHAVLGFYAWVGAFLLALVLPFVAERMAASASQLMRLGAVALGTAAWLPIFAVVVRIIQSGDEYQRRLHLSAAALAFIASLLLMLPLSWLVEAGFVEPPSLQLLWVAAMLVWAASVFVVKRRFERQS